MVTAKDELVSLGVMLSDADAGRSNKSKEVGARESQKKRDREPSLNVITRTGRRLEPIRTDV